MRGGAVRGTAARGGAGPHILPEIQALRALAVLLVVVFHLWPERLAGGYVGVDVFFVISGFLISSHLMREVQRTGGVSLRRFWARRIARLLPAAFLVLAVTLVLVLVFMPQTTWQQAMSEIGASAVYVQNWLLAFNATDYFAAEQDPSAVQHYWSLSVEEQFYLVWPVVVLATALVARRLGAPPARLLLGAVTAIFVASLAYSILVTASDRAFAYFSTFAHAWEFAAGGMLALSSSALSRWPPLPATVRAALGWCGLLAILVSAVLFTGQSPFPGWIALLPVAGTLACIRWGDAGLRWDVARVLDFAPVQRVGDVSYSLYLWHWPLIVVFPFAFGTVAADLHKWGLFAASLVLAWLTYTTVENRFRWDRGGSGRAVRSYAFALASSLALVLACFGTWWLVDAKAGRPLQVDARGSCKGAAAAAAGNRCPESHVLADVGLALAAKNDKTLEWLAARADSDPAFRLRCDREAVADIGAPGLGACRVGDRVQGAPGVALVGDSHAEHFLAVVAELTRERGWNLVVYKRNSCRPTLPSFRSAIPADAEQTCLEWKQRVIDHIAAHEETTLVITSSGSRRYNFSDPESNHPAISDGYRGAWRAWRGAGKRVLVISDVPLSYTDTGKRVNVPTCVAAAGGLVDPCALPRAGIGTADPMTVAATGNPDVEFLDLTPIFCDEERCHFVVGGMVTHRDDNHITPTFALTLRPFIAAAVDRALR